MSIRGIFIFVFSVFIALLAILVYVSYLAGENQHLVATSESRRLESYKLADELRQSSDDLTRMARTYVSTGNSKYEEIFFNILAIRNGEKPRPQHYDKIYWDFVIALKKNQSSYGETVALEELMRRNNFSNAEFSKLQEAQANSDELVKMEEVAMNAMKGLFQDADAKFTLEQQPDPALARKIMFGPEYHVAKANIMKPINEFMNLLDERTKQEVLILYEKEKSYRRFILILIILNIAFAFLALIILNRRLIVPLRQLVSVTQRVQEGDYQVHSNIDSKDEVGVLALAFNHMTGAIQKDIQERNQAAENLEKQALEARLLHRATEIASDTESFDEALQLVVNLVCKMTQSQLGHVYKPSIEDPYILEPTKIWHVADEDSFSEFQEMTEQTYFNMGEGLPGKIMKSGEPVWIPNVQIDTSFPRNKQLSDKLKVRAAFGFPVKISGENVAVLEFFSCEVLEVDEGLINILTNVGHQLGRVFERRQATELLKEARKEADAANEAKSTFLASMSHEIRTPMNAIINMTGLTLETEINNKQRQYLNVVNSSSKTLLALINDILDFSKIEAGKLDIEFAQFQLRSLLEDITDTFRDKVINKHIEYIVHVNLEVPETIVGDALRLRQVLINLLGNAFKFTERGEVVLKVELLGEINKDSGKANLKFSVKDSGIGITKEQQAKLFQSFTQADASTSRKYGGTGLGLTISKSLVHMMNGDDIQIESEPDKGTIFSFVLPFEVAEQSQRRQKILPAELDNLKILIVEDNMSSRNLLETILESFGLQSTSVITAEEGLDALKNTQEFGIILMDWQLPGMDGLTATEVIKNDPELKQIPVIMASAYSGEEELKRADQIGVEAFLNKPIKPSSLFNAIMEAKGIQIQNINKPSKQIHEREFNNVPVLLAEDNEANQFVAQELLGRLGIRLDIADNGLIALEKMKSNEYAAILMDIQMPEMDGLEATRQLRKLYPDNKIPIIAMTANAMKGDREICFEAGMDDYVTKPIDKTELLRALRKWLPTGSGEFTNIEIEEQEEINQELPSIEGIDIEAAIRRLELPLSSFEKMLARFTGGQREVLEALSQAVKQNKQDEIRLHAHSLAGAGGNISAIELRKKSKTLEIAAKERTGNYEELFNEVKATALAVFDSIDKHVQNAEVNIREHTEIKAVSVDQLKKVLITLKEKLASFDLDEINAALDALRKCGKPPQDAELFRKTESAIEDYNHDEAGNCIDELLAKLD